MDKISKRASSLLLILTIASSYLMWIVGIDTKITAFIYSNSMYFLLAIIGLVLMLNLQRMEKGDWGIILFAISIFVFYTLTSSIRHSNRFINGVIPVIILLVLCFKLCKFDKWDKAILLGVSGVSLVTILLRLYVELPKLIPTDMIGKMGNKIETIWINTNTIGAALLFSVLMTSILIKNFTVGYYKLIVIPIYLLGGFGIWAVESKTAFMVLILFVFIDNLIPKTFLQKNKWWVVLFIGVFLIAPLISYHFSQSATMSLFTERERIWKELFGKLFSNNQNVLIGMQPFVASWKPLGTHNSFLNILANYGVIGYLIITGLFSYWLIQMMLQKRNYSKIQVSLTLAFLIIWMHSLMEDIMTAYHWMPIIYSFIGIALQKPDDLLKQEKSLRSNKKR